jgi:hypothetical protein
MRLLFLLAIMYRLPLVSSDMCVLCRPGKYQTNISNSPCKPCGSNTFAPTAGMTACLLCGANSASAPGSSSCACISGYVWSNVSVGCVSACGAGFTHNATGGCVPLSDEKIVLKYEMTLAMPAGIAKSDIQSDLTAALATTYGISPDRLLVDLVAIPARRRLFQTTEVNYLVEVKVSFPAGTSANETLATQQRLAAIDPASFMSAMRDVPNAKITVLGSTLKEVSVVLPPSAPPTTPPSAPPTTTPAPVDGGGGNVAVIAAAASAACIVVLALIACAIKRKPKSLTDPS